METKRGRKGRTIVSLLSISIARHAKSIADRTHDEDDEELTEAR